MRKLFRTIITLLVCAALIAGGALLGPRLYGLLFGGANARWVSERFSQQLTEKRELIVLEKTITGQESVSTDAWLIGTVQRVTVPYTFTASFSVDMRQASVRFDGDTQTIQVTLPAPVVSYWKMTVDEDAVEKSDLLIPAHPRALRPDQAGDGTKAHRRSQGRSGASGKAWAAAVSETQALYQAVLAGSDAASFTLQVTQAETNIKE